MKNLLKFSTLIACICILFIQCKNKTTLNDAAVAIPQNAVAVSAFNLPSLMEKADFQNVKQMAFYKDMIDSLSKENAGLADIMANPEKSGVDFAKNAYFVQDYDMNQEGDNANAMTALLSLSNASAFETMLKNTDKNVKIDTKDGVKFIVSTNENKTFIAWNDKMAVLGNYTEGVDFMKYFTQKADKSVLENKQFTQLFSNKHDIYTYVSLDKIADNPKVKGSAGMMNIDPKDLKGNYMTGYADFEKGEIIAKSDYQINPELRKEWGLMFKDNVKTDFSKYLNGVNVGFVMTLGLDMKGIKEILNTSPQFKMAIDMAKSSEVSTDDIFKAFDGDMFISASPTPVKGGKSTGIVGFKLKDRAAIDKLLMYLVNKKIVIAEGKDMYRFANEANNMTAEYVDNGKMMLADDILFVGDAQSLGSVKMTKSDINKDIKDVLNQNIVGIYANLTKIMENTEGLKNPEIKEIKIKMNNKQGESSAKMLNATDNALKSLMNAANKWYLENKNNNKPVVKDKNPI